MITDDIKIQLQNNLDTGLYLDKCNLFSQHAYQQNRDITGNALRTYRRPDNSNAWSGDVRLHASSCSSTSRRSIIDCVDAKVGDGLSSLTENVQAYKETGPLSTNRLTDDGFTNFFSTNDNTTNSAAAGGVGSSIIHDYTVGLPGGYLTYRNSHADKSGNGNGFSNIYGNNNYHPICLNNDFQFFPTNVCTKSGAGGGDLRFDVDGSFDGSSQWIPSEKNRRRFTGRNQTGLNVVARDGAAIDGGELITTVPPVKKRNTANKKERRRTQSINNAFSDLRDCIPNVPPDTKLSKIKTLRLAYSYIVFLTNVLLSDDPDKAYADGFKADISNHGSRKSFAGHVIQTSCYSDATKLLDDNFSQHYGTNMIRGISENNPEEMKKKGRTGWPQHVWALELKPEEV